MYALILKQPLGLHPKYIAFFKHNNADAAKEWLNNNFDKLDLKKTDSAVIVKHEQVGVSYLSETISFSIFNPEFKLKLNFVKIKTEILCEK